jgi:hypothetical protein
MEALAAEYRPKGVRFLIVAADDEGRLRQFADSASVRVPMAYTGGQLALYRIFDRSARFAPFLSAIGLPSFLVLNDRGTVVERKAGVLPEDLDAEGLGRLKQRGLIPPDYRQTPGQAFAQLRAALDSLLTEPQRARPQV